MMRKENLYLVSADLESVLLVKHLGYRFPKNMEEVFGKPFWCQSDSEFTV